MKLLSLFLVLLAVSACAQTKPCISHGHATDCPASNQADSLTLQPAVAQPGFWIISEGSNAVVTCGASADGKAKNCVISPGHTLDDAMNAVFQAMKQESDQHQKSIDAESSRADALYKITVRENKALYTCSDGLRKAVKSMKKFSKP